MEVDINMSLILYIVCVNQDIPTTSVPQSIAHCDLLSLRLCAHRLLLF